MKKKTKYTDEPIAFKEIKDFLPAPEHLAAKEIKVKVTITLSKNSVDFFRKHAKKEHGHYQTMIRKVIDYYVDRHAS